ncbi:MAG: hypothetical protein ACOY37_00105 [Pseudomonadota bacterium]
MSRWANLGPVAELLFEGFEEYARRQARASTRLVTLQSLNNGFIEFCREDLERTGAQLPYDFLSSKTLKSFSSWLDARQTSKVELLSPQTKMSYLSAVRVVTDCLQKRFKELGVECVCPPGSWKLESRGPKTKALAPKDHAKLVRLAAEQVMQTIGAVEPVLDRVIAGLDSRRHGTKDAYIDLVVSVLRANDHLLPERKRLPRDTRKSLDEYGYKATQIVVAPQLNDLAPFILYLALFTGFNEQPLLSLRLDEIDPVSILGSKRITLRPLKHRGKMIQPRSFVATSSTLCPTRVIAFIEKWTSVIRRRAPEHCKPLLFIAANKWKHESEHAVLSFDGDIVKGRQVATAITNFLKGHFSHFIGTRIIRSSFAELADVVSGGDALAIKAVLGHTIEGNTLDEYRSHDADHRSQERLAVAMAHVQRTAASYGKIDARNQNRKSDRSAATPGWSCLDPYESPMPAEQSGRLCGAYGRCPGCPLGSPSGTGPESFARALQLLGRMDEAILELGIVTFKKRFGDAYSALREIHLPRLATDFNIDKARTLSLNALPKLV